MSSETSSTFPDSSYSSHVLALLDKLMALPGAQASHYQVVRRMLEDRLPLEAYSLHELQAITGKSETTCKGIKRWLLKSGLLLDIQSLVHGRRDSAPCMIPSTKISEEKKEHPIPHEAEFSPDPVFRLALDKLNQMEWGKKDGFQLCDPAVFVERYGASAVLYATWCAGGKGIQNPAAFVTWWCQQGKPAPEGWQHPELRQPAPTALSPSALEMPGAPISGPELPAISEALQPAWEWIRERIRPQSWGVWFAPHSMTAEQEGEAVCFWAGSPVAANWIEGRYAGLIAEALRETLGYVPEVRFQVVGGIGRG